MKAILMWPPKNTQRIFMQLNINRRSSTYLRSLFTVYQQISCFYTISLTTNDFFLFDTHWIMYQCASFFWLSCFTWWSSEKINYIYCSDGVYRSLDINITQRSEFRVLWLSASGFFSGWSAWSKKILINIL